MQTDDWLDSVELICTKTDAVTKYDFNKFTSPLKFTLKIYNRNLTLKEAENDQPDLKIITNKLNNDYNPRKQAKRKEKTNVIKCAKKIYFMREEIIDAFKEGIFPYIDGFQVEKETDEKTDKQPNTTDMPELENEESVE